MEAERVEWRDRTWTKAGKDQKDVSIAEWPEKRESAEVAGSRRRRRIEAKHAQVMWYRIHFYVNIMWDVVFCGEGGDEGVKEDFIMEYENLFLAALLVALLYEKKTCLIFCNLFCGMIIFLWAKKKKFRTMV